MTIGLHAEQLILAYKVPGGFQTVLDVDALSVAAGSAIGITGPSGSGKTSLLYVLAGIERPQYGRVRWGETEITTLSESERDRWRREHVGMVFQDFHLIPGMTVLQNVLLASTFTRLRSTFAMKDQARALLTSVGLRGGLQPAERLSRGEMQRVAIARALLFKPAIVLADEPTASLDAANGERVIGLLLELCREARSTLVVVSHDTAVLRRLDGVHTLVAGRFATADRETVSRC